MATVSKIRQFSLHPSDAADVSPIVVGSLQEFKICRTRIDDRPAGDIRIFFKGDGSRFFINPLYISNVLKEARDFGSKRPSLIPASCVLKWRFSSADDVKLLEFDELCQKHGVHTVLVHIEHSRYLLPHRAREFLRLACNLDQADLQRYFISFQRLAARKGHGQDYDEAFANKVFALIGQLDDLEGCGDLGNEKLISCSMQLQKALNIRFGASATASADEDQLLSFDHWLRTP